MGRSWVVVLALALGTAALLTPARSSASSDQFNVFYNQVRKDLKYHWYPKFNAGPAFKCHYKALVEAHNALAEKFGGDATVAVASAVIEGIGSAVSSLGFKSAEAAHTAAMCALNSKDEAEFAKCLGDAVVDEMGLGKVNDAYKALKAAQEKLAAEKREVDNWEMGDTWASSRRVDVDATAVWYKNLSEVGNTGLGAAGSGGVLYISLVLDCECEKAGELEWAHVKIWVPINIVQYGSGYGVEAGPIKELDIIADCCEDNSGRERMRFDRSLRRIADDHEHPIPRPPAGGGGGGATTTAGGGGGAAAPPPPPKPPEPQPPKWSVDNPCPECQDLADQVKAAEQALADAQAPVTTTQQQIADAQAALVEANEQINSLKAKISAIQTALDSSDGNFAESFDPSTGTTTRAEDRGDGFLTITTTTADGKTSTRKVPRASAGDLLQQKAQREQELKDAEAKAAGIQAQIDALNTQLQAQQADVAARQAALDALKQQLEDCIKRCNKHFDYECGYKRRGDVMIGPDGKVFASYGDDGNMIIYDQDTWDDYCDKCVAPPVLMGDDSGAGGPIQLEQAGPKTCPAGTPAGAAAAGARKLVGAKLQQVRPIRDNNPFDARDPLNNAQQATQPPPTPPGPPNPPPPDPPGPPVPPPQPTDTWQANQGPYNGVGNCNIFNTNLGLMPPSTVILDPFGENGMAAFQIDPVMQDNASHQAPDLVINRQPGWQCQIQRMGDNQFGLNCFNPGLPPPQNQCMEQFNR